MSALLTTPCERKTAAICSNSRFKRSPGVFAGNPSCWFLAFTIQLHLQVVFVKLSVWWQRGGVECKECKWRRSRFPHLLMLPSAPWHRMAIVALVTFVRFFSRVRFQMHPQIVCSMRCIVTLVAFICPFSIVHRTIHSFRRSVHSEDKMLTAWLDFTKISHHWWVQIFLFLNTWQEYNFSFS